ncbi:MFS transporter [Solihabitans fulvus]|uniref:MFS transporter n=1 Tax=Solihabitans fulvus TaxID=1892852 RepID=A0A5B2WX40_9PSEU|nr:MFS transporter [Solihabitans fulvus]KAA2256065.1 MFS transporter [Solihabitans fulvus]
MRKSLPTPDDTEPQAPRPGRFAGMGGFSLIWGGHVVSLVGNSVLRFAFIIEAWSAGERATAVTTLSLCALLPQVLLSPVAGAVIDRVSKRAALQFADTGGLVIVGLLAILQFAGGGLESWQVYPAVALLGAAAAFQYPAMASSVPMLVRKDQLQRANGLLASAKSTADICGPALGGVLIALSGIGVILAVDLISFVLALVAIRVVRFKGDEVRKKDEAGPRKKIAAEAVAGLRYLFTQPSLRDLILTFCVVNLVMIFGFAAVQPMVLTRTGNNTAALASVNTAIGIGGVAGGLLMAAWGGPRNRGRGMMTAIIGMCLSAQVAMALAGGVVGWCAAILVGALIMPVINGSMQSIVQTKVPQEWQGRVFGAVMFLSQISVPLATAVSGPLADHVFEPQASAGTGVFVVLGPLLGNRPGSGMAAMLLIAGLCGIAVALWGLARRSVRDIDTLLPDLEG